MDSSWGSCADTGSTDPEFTGENVLLESWLVCALHPNTRAPPKYLKCQTALFLKRYISSESLKLLSVNGDCFINPESISAID